MPNFICNNSECEDFNKPVFYHKVVFRFDEMNCLEPIPPIICGKCGSYMVSEQTAVKTDINQVNIGSFKGMGDYDKRRHIKNRAKVHYDKHEKKSAQMMRDNLINKMKEGLEP